MAYKTILTNYGNDKILEAIANDTYVEIASMAYGDGGGFPTDPQVTDTSLVNQVGLLPIATKEFDSDDGFIYFTSTVPGNAPSVTIRELGLIDVDGGLIAIASIPDTEKPDAEEGVAVTLPISMGFKTSAGNVLIIQIDGSETYATKAYVDKLDENNVHITGTETITGQKTFTVSPFVPDSTSETGASAAAGIKYVDSLEENDVHLTGNETIDGVKTFLDSPVIPTPESTSYGDIATTTKWVKDYYSSRTAPNVVIIGEPSIDNGQISGFTSTSYAQLPFIFDPQTNEWTIEMNFTTGSNVTTQQNILDSMSDYGVAFAISNEHFILALSSDGITWDIANSQAGTAVITTNTTYYVHIIFDGSKYTVDYSTDGQTYTTDITVTNSSTIHSSTILISGVNHVFNGSVDLNHWSIYLNSTKLWAGIDETGLATRANIDLSNLSRTGQAVLDDKANVNLSNLSSQGQSIIDNKANIDLSNLSNTGQAILDGKGSTLDYDYDKAELSLLNSNGQTLSTQTIMARSDWGTIQGNIADQIEFQAIDNFLGGDLPITNATHISYLNGRFIVTSTTVGTQIAVSTNAETWTTSSSSNCSITGKGAYGNGYYILPAKLNSNLVCLTSTNSTSWTVQTIASSGDWAGLVYSTTLSKFIGLTTSGTIYSGTTAPTTVGVQIASKTFVNLYRTTDTASLLATASDGTVYITKDLSTWTELTNTGSSSHTNIVKNITANRLIAYSKTATSNQIKYSNTLTIYNDRIKDVRWFSSSDRWIAVSETGKILYSTDFENWYDSEVTGIFTCFGDYENTVFAFGSPNVMTTTDGVNWSIFSNAYSPSRVTRILYDSTNDVYCFNLLALYIVVAYKSNSSSSVYTIQNRVLHTTSGDLAWVSAYSNRNTIVSNANKTLYMLTCDGTDGRLMASMPNFGASSSDGTPNIVTYRLTGYTGDNDTSPRMNDIVSNSTKSLFVCCGDYKYWGDETTSSNYIWFPKRAFIYSSTNGTSWTRRYLGPIKTNYETTAKYLIFVDNHYIALSSSQYSYDCSCFTSTNGTSWTRQVLSSPYISAGVHAHAYNSGTLVIASNYGLSTSTDYGVTWTQTLSINNFRCNGLTYQNGLFIAPQTTYTSGSYTFGETKLWTSIDGINWVDSSEITWSNATISSPSCLITDIAQIDQYLVASCTSVSGNNVSFGLRSTNSGLLWNQTIEPSNTWTGVTYGNNKFLTISKASENGSATSSDYGATWVQGQEYPSKVTNTILVSHPVNTQLGTPNRPVYIKSNGVPEPITASVGSNVRPMYISNGILYQCEYGIDYTRFDGPFVSSYLILSTAAGSGTFEFNLSSLSYLPDDGFSYLVQMNTIFYDAGDTNGQMFIETDIWQQDNATTRNMLRVNQGNQYARHNSNVFMVPVGPGRFIKWYCSDANTNRSVSLTGYRRLGTNP